MNINGLVVFAYACQNILMAGRYTDLNDLLEFSKKRIFSKGL